jgi:hypothetical protein
MKSRGYTEPVYRPGRDQKTSACIILGQSPLQAADMLAYELRLNYDRHGDQHEDDSALPYRKSFLALANSANHQGFWARVTREEMEAIGANLGLDRPNDGCCS